MFHSICHYFIAPFKKVKNRSPKRLVDYITLSGLRLVDAATGILKDVFLTKAFGLGLFLDSYFVVTSILDIFSGYFQIMGYAVLLPLYNSEAKEEKSDEEILRAQNLLINAFMNYIMLAMLGMALVTVVLHQWIAVLIVPSKAIHEAPYLDLLLLISLPIGMLFQGSYALRIILIQRKRFAMFHIPAILSTLLFIGLFLILYPIYDYYAVIWALIVSQIFQFFLYWFTLGIKWQYVWKTSFSGTMLKLLGTNCLNWLLMYLIVPVDNYFLGLLPPGELSAFRYAAKITTVLLALTVSSLTITMVPALTVAASRHELSKMQRLIIKSISESFIFSLLLILIVFMFAQTMVSFLFQRGAFSAEDSKTVTLSLQIMIFSMPFLGSLILVRRSWESLYLIKPFLIIGFISLCMRVLLDWAGLTYWGLEGIAWSYVVHPYLILMIELGYLFYRVKNFQSLPNRGEEKIPIP